MLAKAIQLALTRLTVLYTEMLPPCASMMALAIVRLGVCSGLYIAAFALYFLIGALYYGNASPGVVCDGFFADTVLSSLICKLAYDYIQIEEVSHK